MPLCRGAAGFARSSNVSGTKARALLQYWAYKGEVLNRVVVLDKEEAMQERMHQ